MGAARYLAVFLLLGGMHLQAQQATPYILTDFPLSATPADQCISIKWTGVSRRDEKFFRPDSGVIYYGITPGGSKIANYTDSVTVFCVDTQYVGSQPDITVLNNVPVLINNDESVPPQREIRFRPVDQNNMGPGVYYFMVGWRTSVTVQVGPLTRSVDTTFYSNEMQLIVETDVPPTLTTPPLNAKLTDLTPSFEWERNPGVPYYHVIVTDDEITLDSSAGDNSVKVDGLSIIWEAITPSTQITYGAPDPSGTITASPPPLSPGLKYSWTVLNNYGNHPAYTSYQVFGLPRTFAILGDQLTPPLNISPKNDTLLTSSQDSIIRLEWTNLDPRANTYKVYIYVASDMEQLGAQLVVWEDEIAAGEFEGDSNAYVDLDARSILTTNNYTWKAIAVDDRGAGRVGEATGFRYQAPTGKLRILTKEEINTASSSLVVGVAAVELKLEVLDGSLEAPLLFYTDNNGLLVRDRPRGTYRITAVKDGFLPLSRTLIVDSAQTTVDTFFLQRPAAKLYGKVIDALGDPIGLASITAVSDLGDTVRTQSDALGSYVLSCEAADWTVWAGKKGYINAAAIDTTVASGRNLQLPPFSLSLNPYVLSGIVRNELGQPLIGANVKLYREGVAVDQVPSTPQSGVFSFLLESGTYTLTADKTGFTSYSAPLQVLASKNLQITMRSRAAVVKGSVYGRSWSKNRFVYAPITGAKIQFIESTTSDTLTTVSDKVYGNFTISLPGAKSYFMRSSAVGFVGKLRSAPLTTVGGKTLLLADTLVGLASLSGRVITRRDERPVDNVAVSLIDTSGNIIATTGSDLRGSFGVRNIPDGSYTITAGKTGVVTDTVRLIGSSRSTVSSSLAALKGRIFALPVSPSDTLFVDSVSVKVREGNRYITWAVEYGGAPLNEFAVKVRSPLAKTLEPRDTLAGVGLGTYVLTVDADADTVIDLARHTLTIDTATPLSAVDTTMDSLGQIDTVRYYYSRTLKMPLTHSPADSISLSDGATTIDLIVNGALLDEGFIYYRDLTAPTFDSIGLAGSTVTRTGETSIYSFALTPKKNGSTMHYYFRARIGSDWYGYSQETFSTYVRPDTTRLSKVAISPSSADTLVLPSDAQITFRFQGYYGSKFIPANGLVDIDVAWEVTIGGRPAPARMLSAAQGLEVTIDASQATFDSVYLLTATVDTTRRSLAPGVSSSAAVTFTVSDQHLDSIVVIRVGNAEGPITTSALAKAMFVAEGVDASGQQVIISPTWSIYPPDAGSISAEGVFKPSPNFLGWVQVYAEVEGIRGEFNRRTDVQVNLSGLQVNHILGAAADTATNGRDCEILFPDSIIPANISAALSLARPLVRNRVAQNTDNYTVIAGPFDIELWNLSNGTAVPFTRGRTATLRLDIPEDYQDIMGTADLKIGRWDPDSVEWKILDSSKVDPTTKQISVNLTGFSRYAVLYKMDELKGVWNISPNPFSPRVRPVREYGGNAPAGTCIRIKPVAPREPIAIQVDIYNLTSDRVWSVIKQNAAKNSEIRLWWDGTTLPDTYTIGREPGREQITETGISIRGERMCRNGRYFAVLTITSGGEKKQYMKPIILFK